MRYSAVIIAFVCSFFLLCSMTNAAPVKKVSENKGKKVNLQKRVDTKKNSTQAQSTDKQKGKNEALESRIDFGNSYILGQTIKSGAVYLLQRKKSEIKSMLEPRKDYREEILEDFHIMDMKINQ